MSASEEVVRLPRELLDKLRAHAEELGVDLPGVAKFAPRISVKMPTRQLAEQVGQTLRMAPVFILGDQVVTIDEESATARTLTDERFVTWAEEFVTFYAPGNGHDTDVSLARPKAREVLASDVFRSKLRRITAVNGLRLPVRRAGGEVELLPEGFDPESGVYTVPLLDYPPDMDPNDAVLWLIELVKDYPWADLAGQDPAQIRNNRSVAVHVAAMVGVFVRHFFPPCTRRPMILYVGNQPGTGKSTLVSMALSSVFGFASTSDCPKDAAEMEKLLGAMAQSFAPYVWFDDLGRGLFSNALNRFITASRHRGRIMGGKEVYDVENVSQVFATGNDVETTRDLMRRSLVAELFLPGDLDGRRFERTIDDVWLASPDVRKKTCAALWAIVRWWAECPAQVPRAKDSFEVWTQTVASIVMSATFANPLEQPDLPAAGDREDAEFRALLCALASSIDDPSESVVFKREDLVIKAREMGILEHLVGADGEPDLKPQESRRFGLRLKKWRGRRLMDASGRAFEFGRRHERLGAVYPVRFLA